MRRWLAVYRAEPCPICGKPDWCNRAQGQKRHPVLAVSRHRQDLRHRGLDDAAIQHGGYRTLALQGRARMASALVDRFGEALSSRIPGIIRRQGEHGNYWSLACQPGMIVPVRS